MRRFLFFLSGFLLPVLIHAETTVDFRAFIQCGYTHRETLPGASSTAAILQRSLENISGTAFTAQTLRDRGPEELKLFLQGLPEEKQADWSVVYIAGHQSAAGEFEFTGKQKIPWRDLLQDVQVPVHRQRITVLDACYAEAADLRSDIARRLGPFLVFTSAAGERTYELELGSRRPVDFARRYPREMAWLQKETGPVRQITFFGLMWTSAFVEKAPAPLSLDAWKAFWARVGASAELFRSQRSEKLSSEMVVRGM